MMTTGTTILTSCRFSLARAPDTRRRKGETMKWDECLKIRWQAVTAERWELRIGAEAVAIVQSRGTHFIWSAGGQFDWHPTRRGAMRQARWEFWVNRSPRYSASVVFTNRTQE